MQNYLVRLESEVFETFRCQKAANSLDIDSKKKSIHELKINADLKTPFNVGLIVGSSGSGKTTLAKKIFGDDCFKSLIRDDLPIIDQFPKSWSYEDCSKALMGIGLTSVPCWIRPVYTLSNGQRVRAEAALLMAGAIETDIMAIDEWTSVVDRNVAKVMSHCVQKHARRSKRSIVLCSCHYDVIEWLNPDFIIDCNKQEYIDRRSMVGAFKRTDQLRCDIREVSKRTWPYFSKYHYLSSNLPGGRIHTYGLFIDKEQIGFQCFAAYIIGNMNIFFSNRTVIHPDYAGLGMGIILINETSKIMVEKGFKIKAKFSSIPVYKAMARQKEWRLTKVSRPMKRNKIAPRKMSMTEEQLKRREASVRNQTTTYHFDYIGSKNNAMPKK